MHLLSDLHPSQLPPHSPDPHPETCPLTGFSIQSMGRLLLEKKPGRSDPGCAEGVCLPASPHSLTATQMLPDESMNGGGRVLPSCTLCPAPGGKRVVPSDLLRLPNGHLSSGELASPPSLPPSLPPSQKKTSPGRNGFITRCLAG